MIAVYFWFAQKAKELARNAAKKYCQQSGVQLLDDTVSLKKIKLEKSRTGLFRIRREYIFEFTLNGDIRYNGELILSGSAIERIQLEPHLV